MDSSATRTATPDVTLRRRFEREWRDGRASSLTEYLPPDGDPNRLEALVELVILEIRLSWLARRDQPEDAPPDRIEAYLDRFPELRRPEITRRMAIQEYRLRHWTGDHPSAEEYRERFPEAKLNELEETWAPRDDGDEYPFQPIPLAPQVPGYEIVERLGSGGAGVVYRAMQLGLRRWVAIKMLLAGAQATEPEAARFSTEAEAVARLSHPHIVQIYEVGRNAEHAWFSMELLEGGTLAQRIGGTPQRAKDAAETLEILSRAVATAHANGIVHRDLKPANVLLSREGIPKIADFGLAKRLEDEAGRTHTGDVLGTPRYMSPEQAAGRTASVGPASDIYSLGAILYEMLTGRPPFVGESAWDTVRMVIENEPTPPRQLYPAIPLDLQTICLKSLQKDPERRFATALEMAEDLGRFSRGEPILARPHGRMERIVRWARRRPVIAALGSTVSVLAIALVGSLIVGYERVRIARDDAIDHERDATEQRNLAVDTLQSVVFDLNRELPLTPESRPLRRKLLQTAIAGLKRAARDSDTAPVIDHSEVGANNDLGDILSELGEPAEALVHYRRAHEAARLLAAEAPDDDHAQDEMAVANIKLGDAYLRMGKTAEAYELYSKAAESLDDLLKSPTEGAKAGHQKTLASNRLGIAATELGNFPAARDHFAEFARGADERARAESGDSFDETAFAAHSRLGDAYLSLGEHQRAQIEFAHCLAMTGESSASRSGPKGIARATAEAKLGAALLAAAELIAAMETLTRARDALAKFATPSPPNPTAALALAETEENLMVGLLGSGDHVTAIEHGRAALALRQARGRAADATFRERFALARLDLTLGEALRDHAQDAAGAQTCFQDAADLIAALAQEGLTADKPYVAAFGERVESAMASIVRGD